MQSGASTINHLHSSGRSEPEPGHAFQKLARLAFLAGRGGGHLLYQGSMSAPIQI